MYIRLITPEDYSSVLAIQNSFWTPQTSPVYDKVWTEKDITIRIGDRSNMLLAVQIEQIAGVLSYSPFYPFEQGQHVGTFGVIVHPNFTKQGIARKLIKHLIELAPNLNYKKIAIHVTGGNQPAISLYESLGFTLEACLKKQLCIEGKYHDGLIFGLWLENNND